MRLSPVVFRFLGRLFAVLAVGGLFAAAALPAAAQARRNPAGYVTAVEVPADAADLPVIRREGQELDIAIWSPLFAGDVVDTRGKGRVTIETAKDGRLVLDDARRSHAIEGEIKARGRFSEIAGVIGDLFRAKPATRAVNLVGRTGEGPALRLGGGVRQQVVSGQGLWVGWLGGTAPFTVEITGQTASRKLQIGVLASQPAAGQEAMITVPASASGSLTLIVRDATGQMARLRLNAGAMPTIPDWATRGAPTPEFRAVAEALYLVGLGNRAYELLAASRAATHRTYPPVEPLLRLLAEGKRPQ